jgi:molybdopterin-containing oxidoreductase family membrane subunit
MVSCNVISPQFFWFRNLRRNPLVLFVISIFVNIGMWFERFVRPAVEAAVSPAPSE